MAAWFKEKFCGRSPAEIVDSNPAARMDFVSCVLSGRGLCFGLITRPEDSYRMCVCVCVCVMECDQVQQ